MPRQQPLLIPSALGWALLSQAVWLPLVAIDLHDRWQASLRQQQLETTPLASRSPATSASAAGNLPEPQTRAVEPGTSGRSTGPSFTSTGLLLGGSQQVRDPLLFDPFRASGSDRAPSPPASAVPARPPSATLSPARPATPREALSDRPRRALSRPQRATPQPVPVLSARPLSPFDPLLGGFSRSELLGGPLSLHDRDAPLMPAVAMAERARWASSGDPLAPLPSDWREPMRRALRALPQPAAAAARPSASKPTSGSDSKSSVARSATRAAQQPSRTASPAPEADPGPRLQTARVVHLPSSRVKRPTAVPLALQSDGSVDILSRPDDPAVVEEIRNWSGRQKAPETGSIAPAVVHLEPMPEPGPAGGATAPPPAPLAATPAAPAPPAAAAQAVTSAPAAAPAAVPAPAVTTP